MQHSVGLVARSEPHRVNQTTARPRLAFAALLFATTWVGDEFDSGRTVAPWFEQSPLFGIPYHYFLFAVLVAALAPVVLRQSPFPFSASLRLAALWRWGVAGFALIAFYFGLALVNGADELFVDWRNFVVIAVVAGMSARWLSRQPWRQVALIDAAILFGCLATLDLLGWLLGGGDDVLGVRVPVWYHIKVLLIAFAAIVATDVWINENSDLGRWHRRVLPAIAAISSLVVVMSFRRSFWLMLLAGLGMVAWRAARLRSIARLSRAVFVGVFVLLGAVIALGPDTLAERAQSFSLSSANRFSVTNSDHLGDLLDAWHVIQENPVLGLGIGTFCATDAIIDWKDQSFEVHSAVLNAWLKFGVLGVVVYIGFHLRWIRAALRIPPSVMCGSTGAGIFLIGVQIHALLQTWPYASFQLSVAHGVILGALLVGVRDASQSFSARRPSSVSA